MSERGWDFFVMSLAHTLGMTRRQLLNNLDSRELTYWSAFNEEMNNPNPKKHKQKDVEKQLKGVLSSSKKVKKHA